MRIALKSALMLTTRVIQIINPELHRHMQRTALIALTLAQRLGLPAERQQTIFCAALLHDIGVLGDKRTIHSLDAIDNIHDPHQRQGAAMLEGLVTFLPIVPSFAITILARTTGVAANSILSISPMPLNGCCLPGVTWPAGPHGRWWNSSSPCTGRSIRRCAICCARSLKMRTSGSTFIPAIFNGCWNYWSHQHAVSGYSWSERYLPADCQNCRHLQQLYRHP